MFNFIQKIIIIKISCEKVNMVTAQSIYFVIDDNIVVVVGVLVVKTHCFSTQKCLRVDEFLIKEPDGIRTRATALRGRRARPLHNGAAGVPGLEPRLTEPESVGLPITPYPKAFDPRGPTTRKY